MQTVPDANPFFCGIWALLDKRSPGRLPNRCIHSVLHSEKTNHLFGDCWGPDTEKKTSLNVCLVSKRYRKGVIGTESKLTIVHFQMSFRPTCCPQGYSSIRRGKW